MKLKKIMVVLGTILVITFGIKHLIVEKTTINLHCTVSYEKDNWQNNRTGLLWALSYLGANFSSGQFDKNIKWLDSTTFNLDFENLGFSEKGLNALKIITDSIKQKEYYKNFNRIDIGQFIALTIGSSWHYYAVTNAPKTYTEFLRSHPVVKPTVFCINNSSVSNHFRVIRFNASDDICNSYYIAEEGKESSNDVLIKIEFYEVLDVMKNGQLRFIIYDSNGNLVSGSPKKLGEAGKPAKCIWCHEIVFQPLFSKTDSLSTGIAPGQFQKVIERQNSLLMAYRKKLNSDIDFNKTQDHTLMELLYISYMEPSLLQLSKEWNMSIKDLKSILDQQITHTHHEFTFLKDLYHRRDVEIHAPCKLIKVPDDIRESCMYEPHYQME